MEKTRIAGPVNRNKQWYVITAALKAERKTMKVLFDTLSTKQKDLNTNLGTRTAHRNASRTDDLIIIAVGTLLIILLLPVLS